MNRFMSLPLPSPKGAQEIAELFRSCWCVAFNGPSGKVPQHLGYESTEGRRDRDSPAVHLRPFGLKSASQSLRVIAVHNIFQAYTMGVLGHADACRHMRHMGHMGRGGSCDSHLTPISISSFPMSGDKDSSSMAETHSGNIQGDRSLHDGSDIYSALLGATYLSAQPH